jgi:hypothetical protein
MFNTILNKKGIGLLEAMIAVFITTVAVVAVIGIQPIALRTAAGSDYMGRAVAIAQAEAARRETALMTFGAPLPADFANELFLEAVHPTVQNIPFRVTTRTVVNPNFWLVSVNVMWPQAVNGVTYYRVITQQMGY